MGAWLADVEAEFWKAHNEVMDATGFRTVLNSFTSSLPSSSSAGGGLFQHLRGVAVDFYAAIKWSEPFFSYLLAFHVVVWAAVLLSTRGAVSDERLVGICVALTVAVLAGTGLNSVGSRYADSIFVEPGLNYFSEDGVFIAVVYMAPLILLIVALQLRMAYRVVTLMVQVKRAQVTQRLRRESKAKGQTEALTQKSKKQQ